MAALLLVSSDAPLTSRLTALLESRGHEVEATTTTDAVGALVAGAARDMAIIDGRDAESHEVTALARASLPDEPPILLLLGAASEDGFLRALAAGATDCVGSEELTDAALLARVALCLARAGRRNVERRRPDSAPLPGGQERAFERYRVADVLGQGGYGTVYDALDLQTGSPVALKVLSAAACCEQEARTRFLREIYSLSSVRSPRIVRVSDFGCHEGRLYMAMERVDGPSLSALVFQRGRLGERALAELLLGASQALVALGAADLVHRDVKPPNIILRDGRTSEPVLVDFGLAKHPFDRGVTSPWISVGSPGYVAPECFLGRRLDARADMFSLSIVLRFAATRRELFADLDGLDLVRRMMRPLPPALGVPELLRPVVERMGALDPKDRYAPDELVAVAQDLASRAAPHDPLGPELPPGAGEVRPTREEVGPTSRRLAPVAASETLATSSDGPAS